MGIGAVVNVQQRALRTFKQHVVAEGDEELIAEVLAASTGIPVFKLTEEESSRLLNMEVCLLYTSRCV